MKVRDSCAIITGDTSEVEMPSGGLEIIADDGRTLFDIHLLKDGTLEVSSGMTCKHKGFILDSGLMVIPKASNDVLIARTKYKP